MTKSEALVNTVCALRMEYIKGNSHLPHCQEWGIDRIVDTLVALGAYKDKSRLRKRVEEIYFKDTM
tara:strand:+ start:12650 stop:12847 length:198 start_codon:yes stop_codon:yes gene_type:complete